MENAVKSRFAVSSVRRSSDVQKHRHPALISPADGTFQYRTLGEALATWDIAITEVSAGGSVPDLMVVNRGNKLCPASSTARSFAGAKQNRSSTPPS